MVCKVELVGGPFNGKTVNVLHGRAVILFEQGAPHHYFRPEHLAGPHQKTERWAYRPASVGAKADPG